MTDWKLVSRPSWAPAKEGRQPFPSAVLLTISQSAVSQELISLLFIHSETTAASMAGKPVLHYRNVRGRMECIRWLLAAAGVEVGCALLFWNGT